MQSVDTIKKVLRFDCNASIVLVCIDDNAIYLQLASLTNIDILATSCLRTVITMTETV